MTAAPSPQLIESAHTERLISGVEGLAPIGDDVVLLDFSDSGIDTSKPISLIAQGKSRESLNVRLGGGVKSGNSWANLGVASTATNKEILYVTDHVTKAGTHVVVRMRRDGWDRWNGVDWLTLTGALTGGLTDRLYTVSMSDRLLAANGVDKIKSWNGTDGGAIADLDTNAPIAKFIAPIGERLFALSIVNGSLDPYRAEWSDDGDITNWATGNSGVAILEPVGRTGLPEFFRGLSAIGATLALYRQRSITLGLRTGVGVAPFRFTTPIVGVGTESPYSIVSMPLTNGDIFLGFDQNVYFFDGNSFPIAIGDPIWKSIRGRISNLETGVVGAPCRATGCYWLALDTDDDGLLDEAWVFDVGAFLQRRELLWWRVDLSTGYRTISFAKAAQGTDEIVNNVTDVVDTVQSIVDAFTSGFDPFRIMRGDDVGQVSYVDPEASIAGIFTSKDFGAHGRDTTVRRVSTVFDAGTSGQFTVSVSTDGGVTWVAPKTVSFSSGRSQEVTTNHDRSGRAAQVQYQILSGEVEISLALIEVTRAARNIGL